MDKTVDHNDSEFLPAGAIIGYLNAKDKMRLRTGFFPATIDAKASILLVGGHREFLEKYTEFIVDFNRRGFNVYSYDHRGQGGSDRALENKQKSHNPDFDIIVEDMHEVIKYHVKADELEHPLYLIAHSMGVQFALRYLHDYPDVFSRAVLLAPFTNLNIGGKFFTWGTIAYTALANMFGFSNHFAPGQARHKDMIDHDYAFERLTHDRERYNWSQEALNTKPDLFIGGVTFGWIKGVLKNLNIIQQEGYVDQIETSILALLAGDEQVVDNKMTMNLLNQMPNVTYEIIPDARHEMYREKNEIRDQVIEKIVNYLDH